MEPLLRQAKRGGRRRSVDLREVVNGILYVPSTGCQWRALSKAVPPRSTVNDCFGLWSWDGTIKKIHDVLHARSREALGPVFAAAQKKALPFVTTEIVKRSDTAKGFEVMPKRWIVERTIAWLNRCRRLSKDLKNLTRNALAFARLASVRLMLRRICQI